MIDITYKINDFEGPLDLLLHLISEHKMQLFDINIYEIIDQYLAFIGSVDENDLDPTSEFLTMAARLVYMKSVALLPRTDEKEKLERELTGQLIEYALCKEMASRLRDMAEGITYFVREPAVIKLPKDYSIIHDPYDLLKSLSVMQGRILRDNDISRFEPLVTAPIVSVESRVIHILSILKARSRINLSDFFSGSSSRSETVATFLGILELMRDGRIKVGDDGSVETSKSSLRNYKNDEPDA